MRWLQFTGLVSRLPPWPTPLGRYARLTTPTTATLVYSWSCVYGRTNTRSTSRSINFDVGLDEISDTGGGRACDIIFFARILGPLLGLRGTVCSRFLKNEEDTRTRNETNNKNFDETKRLLLVFFSLSYISQYYLVVYRKERERKKREEKTIMEKVE